MLTAFTARPIIQLKPRDKSKIEAILAHGDRIFVGLNTGSLRIYRVNEDSALSTAGTTETTKDSTTVATSPSKKTTATPASPTKTTSATTGTAELLREQEHFARSRIEQLAIIKEANLLVSLAGGHVALHDLSTYELQETLAETKGAAALAVASDIVKEEGIPSIVTRLAVAVKRRLLLWRWQDSELVGTVQDISLATGIKTLMWATGTKLLVGLSASYVLVDVETSAVTDIVGPGSIGGMPGQDGGRFGGVGVASISYMGLGSMVPKPLMTRLGPGELLLAKDINTHFVNTEGMALGRRQIPWAVAPEVVGYSYPFLLSLQATKGLLEVRNPETLTTLQNIPLPSANQIHVPSPGVSLVHAGKGFLVASERCIWRMDALGYDEQIETLVDQAKYDEAISLLNMLEDALLQDKRNKLREVKMRKAQNLFDLRKYRDSMDIFREVLAPPARVIALYPKTISGSLEQESSGSQRVVPEESSQSVSETGDDLAKSSSGTSHGHDPNAKMDSNGDETVKDKSATGNSHDSKSSKPHSIEGKDLRMATLELPSFLVGWRTKLQRFLNFDGTLVAEPEAPQSETGQTLTAEDLLEMREPVSDDVRLDGLRRLAKLIDTTLFRAYMFASPSMAGPLFRLPNFCDHVVVQEKLLESQRYSDLVDFDFGKGLHREALELLQRFGQGSAEDAPEALRGPDRLVAYLQALSPAYVDLILEFAGWPVKAKPDLGMEIFVGDTENAETMPRDRVVAFLQGIDRALAIQYLEHIIDELRDDTPEFHQTLIAEYLEYMKSEKVAKEQRGKTQHLLQQFLRDSRHYEPWRVLPILPKTDPELYEARSIVLGRQGEHQQALSILVFDMHDAEKAEEYCNQVFLAESAGQDTAQGAESRRTSQTASLGDTPSPIFSILLSLYLTPPSPHEPQWAPALTLLAKHGSRLPASSSLGLIPSTFPVQELEAYFTGRIRAERSAKVEAQVVASLRQVVDRKQEMLLRLGDATPGGNRGRNRSVVIREDGVCRACHKRFGGSAVKVLPDESVIHYGCSVR